MPALGSRRGSHDRERVAAPTRSPRSWPCILLWRIASRLRSVLETALATASPIREEGLQSETTSQSILSSRNPPSQGSLGPRLHVDRWPRHAQWLRDENLHPRTNCFAINALCRASGIRFSAKGRIVPDFAASGSDPRRKKFPGLPAFASASAWGHTSRAPCSRWRRECAHLGRQSFWRPQRNQVSPAIHLRPARDRGFRLDGTPPRANRPLPQRVRFRSGRRSGQDERLLAGRSGRPPRFASRARSIP